VEPVILDLVLAEQIELRGGGPGGKPQEERDDRDGARRAAVVRALPAAPVARRPRTQAVFHERRSSTRSRTPTPVGPLVKQEISRARLNLRAMSRCTEGMPCANAARTQPAVIAPPGRPPVFFMSAISLLICSRYSGQRGISHTRSPDAVPARLSRSMSAASFP